MRYLTYYESFTSRIVNLIQDCQRLLEQKLTATDKIDQNLQKIDLTIQ